MQRIRKRDRPNLVLVGLGLAATFWLLDSVVDAFVFRTGTFGETFGSPEPVELWMRTIVSLLTVGFSVYAQRDITEHKRSEAALQRSHEELRNLAERLATIREEERTVIARELHDEFGQALAALKWDLRSISNDLPDDLGAVQERVRLMDAVLDKATTSVREMGMRLRPAILDDLGLVAAIEEHVHQFKDRTGIHCELDLPTTDLTFEPDHATAFFRVLEEALTNVMRHAEAKHVSISLESTDEGLSMVVRDDGKGITDAELVGSTSLGLIGMRERALALGGEVKVCRIVDGGTAVELSYAK